MRNLADTLERLSALKAAGAAFDAPPQRDQLQHLTAFGSNPGALTAKTYAPSNIRPGAPLVVVLHGCTQTAAAYDHGAGWSALAEHGGFALLFPEQQRGNNPNLCFNWFSPEDAKRGGGEACSIQQMIAAVVSKHRLDQRRVFITGLSAGGAMTAVMLAVYPEIFAGGAIIGGLPYGVAHSIPEAFDRMRGHFTADSANLPSLVRAASRHSGDWPSVSIWHGSADATVSATNGEALAAQWRGVHSLGATPASTDIDGRLTRRVWCDANGRACVQHNLISGMGHGVPLAAGFGNSGPYMLDVGVSSTLDIASSWGLIADAAQLLKVTTATAPDPKPSASARNFKRTGFRSGNGGQGVREVIEDALRRAGLM